MLSLLRTQTTTQTKPRRLSLEENAARTLPMVPCSSPPVPKNQVLRDRTRGGAR